MPSPAAQDYLKTIYKLQSDSAVSTTDIARSLKVSSASVTNMIKRLAHAGLLVHESYRGVRLTEAGTKIALETVRHHRLLETYLKERLGYSWADMHEEAEHLEHHISEAFEERIDALLGHPTHDPHGHPIPTADLRLVEVDTVPLACAEAGQTVFVDHVSDSDVGILQYLEDIGLRPQSTVTVVAKAPFDGPLTLSIDGKECILGWQVASSVHVAVR